MYKNTYGSNLSAGSLSLKFSDQLLALSENLIPIKDFFAIYAYKDLLKGRTIKDAEDFLKLKISLNNKLVKEIEMIESSDDEGIKKHKEKLENQLLLEWQNRRDDLLLRKSNLENALKKIEDLVITDKDFYPFFMSIKNKIKIGIFTIEENIAADPKPEPEPDLNKWKENRLLLLKNTVKQDDLTLVRETENLKNIKNWMYALDSFLEKELGQSLPIVANEPE